MTRRDQIAEILHTIYGASVYNGEIIPWGNDRIDVRREQYRKEADRILALFENQEPVAREPANPFLRPAFDTQRKADRLDRGPRPRPVEAAREALPGRENVVAAWEALNAQRAENPTALVAFLCEAGDALAAAYQAECEKNATLSAELKRSGLGVGRKNVAPGTLLEGYAFEDDDSFCGEDRTHQRPWIFVPFCEHENAVDGDGNEKRAILVFPEETSE